MGAEGATSAATASTAAFGLRPRRGLVGSTATGSSIVGAPSTAAFGFRPRFLGAGATFSSAVDSTGAALGLRPRRLGVGASAMSCGADSGRSSATLSALRVRRRDGRAVSTVESSAWIFVRLVRRTGADSTESASTSGAVFSAALARRRTGTAVSAPVFAAAERRPRVFFSVTTGWESATLGLSVSVDEFLVAFARTPAGRPRFAEAEVRDLEGPEVVFALK
ncbi:hypothetical protein B932_2429 [Gluconobacter oxydans H24]|nr:hypothetical protein B932_2429 [Gluconobacter oxydans H24]